MNDAELADLVHSLAALPDKTPFCEFKQNWHDEKQIGTLISAISNAACLEGERLGYIVWGVENDTHKIVGTTFNPKRKISGGNQELQLWLAQMLQPSIAFRFHDGRVDGKRVVALEIPAAWSVSTKFQHIAYIRIGSATPKLSDYSDREAALTTALRPFV